MRQSLERTATGRFERPERPESPQRQERPERPERTGFRKDIEGLRAVAVVLVVLDHLAGWPSAGFIGVDVFFVVSGFLITGLLLDETERRGRLSFRGFYARRARRILPAALTVLAAIVITAHLVFRGLRVSQNVTDARWALGFAANIHFARTGTDYFADNRAPSLVQHFWSLAVEEQFYLVWPVVILIVLTVAGRWLSNRTARLALLAVIAAGSVASFAFAVQQTSHNPTPAYFSSPGRAWELGAGALVAVAAASFRGLGTLFGRARGPMSLLGLAGIVVSAFVVRSAPGFPAPWAALPVLSSVLLIVAGLNGPVGRWGIALTNPVSGYLGRISYSLYLWHWPVILVVAALVPDSALLKYSIAIFAMLGLSVASYHFVESPVRRLSFARPVRRRPRAGWRVGVVRPGVTALACLAVVLVLSALVPQRRQPSFTAAAGAPTLVAHAGPDVAQPRTALSSAINSSLSARAFPDFSPSLDHLGTARGSWGACDGATEANLSQCTFGSKPGSAHVAVVIGDSMALSWFPGIKAALPADNWTIYGLMLEACPAADVHVYDKSRRHYTDCDQRHKWVEQEANRLHPQLVILASADDTLERLGDDATGAQANAEYRAGLQKMITRLHPGPRRHVLTLSPPPKSGDLSTCDAAGSTPADCVTRVSDRWIAFDRVERAAAAATRTVYRDTHLWFCNIAGYCPAFIGSSVVRWDGQHVTDFYAESLSAEIRRVVAAAMGT